MAEAFAHLLKVTRSYWPGLFGCYEVEGLPRINNELEQFFGSYRYHERRCSGRKVACPGTVARGSVRLVAAAATRSRPIEDELWRSLESLLEADGRGDEIPRLFAETRGFSSFQTSIGLKLLLVEG